MLELKRIKPDKISVKVSNRRIGSDIIVIPGKLGVILLDVYDSRTGFAVTNASLFYFNPPNKKVIEQLYSWFMEIDSQAGTIPVSEIPA